MGALYRVVTVVGAAALPKGGEDLPKSECVATTATTATTTTTTFLWFLFCDLKLNAASRDFSVQCLHPPN